MLGCAIKHWFKLKSFAASMGYLPVGPVKKYLAMLVTMWHQQRSCHLDFAVQSSRLEIVGPKLSQEYMGTPGKWMIARSAHTRRFTDLSLSSELLHISTYRWNAGTQAADDRQLWHVKTWWEQIWLSVWQMRVYVSVIDWIALTKITGKKVNGATFSTRGILCLNVLVYTRAAWLCLCVCLDPCYCK